MPDIDDVLAAGEGPRVLTIDLERLPGEFTRDIWEPRDLKRLNYLHPDRWDRLPSTLCFSARWWGARTYEWAAAWDNPDDPWHVARAAHELYEQADVVLTYNGNRADNKWLQSDWVEAGLHKPAPWKSIDLFIVARRSFAFESKSLDHLCKRLGVVTKNGRYDAAEAKAAMAGDEALQRRLKRYNQGDVRATEAAAEVLIDGGWVPEWPHAGLWTGAERSCWKCGSEDGLVRDGRAYTAVTAYARYRCSDCGAYSRNNNRQGSVSMRVAR